MSCVGITEFFSIYGIGVFFRNYGVRIRAYPHLDAVRGVQENDASGTVSSQAPERELRLGLAFAEALARDVIEWA
jgi:hypothetical protein